MENNNSKISKKLFNRDSTFCEVCNNDNLKLILNLGNQPLCDDLIPINHEKSQSLFPIEILFCEICKTAHQKYQVSKHYLFPHNYHYRAKNTKDVLNGMHDLVNSCEEKIGSLSGLKVLDIGCNDGSLLKIFKLKNCEVFGIEPSDAAIEAQEAAFVLQDYFDSSSAKRIKDKIGFPDIITFTNVFAHIEDLKSLISALKSIIGENTWVVIENHYLGSIVDKNQFDTFYHEHPRTYSAKSFEFISGSLDCDIESIQFPGRYGGNIRAFIKKNVVHRLEKISNDGVIEKNIFKLQNVYEKWLSDTKKFIRVAVKENGPLHSKAFPARASILINALQLNHNDILVVYEKVGSLKVGNYVPGTMIPIKDDNDLINDMKNIKIMINWAWHISKEIQNYLKSIGFRGKMIDIMPVYRENVIK